MSEFLYPILRTWCRQYWLPFGLRDRLVRRLADPDRMASRPFTCAFMGRCFVGNLSSYLDWHIYFYGIYERAILTLLIRLARSFPDKATFWDVGANVGIHTVALADHVAHVHAFEPWDRARRQLADNIAVNALVNVTVHSFALGDTNNDLPFQQPISANSGTGSFLPDVNINTFMGALPVRVGDSLVAQDVGIRPDIIKIDTEGFEIRVLAGLRQTLSIHRPFVVAETMVTDHSLAMLGEIFDDTWLLYDIGSHPERYRLGPWPPSVRSLTTLLAVPVERSGILSIL